MAQLLVKTWKNENERMSIKVDFLLKKAQHPNNEFIQAFCDKALKELDLDFKKEVTP